MLEASSQHRWFQGEPYLEGATARAAGADSALYGRCCPPPTMCLRPCQLHQEVEELAQCQIAEGGQAHWVDALGAARLSRAGVAEAWGVTAQVGLVHQSAALHPSVVLLDAVHSGFHPLAPEGSLDP